MAQLKSKTSVPDYSHIITLTKDNFKKQVFEDYANFDCFIKFYAPWCPHCKHMQMEWERLSRDLNDDDGTGVKVFEIDADKYKVPDVI